MLLSAALAAPYAASSPSMTTQLLGLHTPAHILTPSGAPGLPVGARGGNVYGCVAGCALAGDNAAEEEDDEDEDDDEDVAADDAEFVVAVVADFVDFISCSNEVPASATARAQHATVNRSIVIECGRSYGRGG